MNDYLDELKNLIMLHVQSQQLDKRKCLSVINRIQREEGNEQGSWTYEWMSLGNDYLHNNQKLAAVQCYNFARFPYVNSDARQKAYAECVNVFQQWANEQGMSIERRVVHFGGEKIPVYVSGLSPQKRPLIIVIGGIVSIKEQWHKFLLEGPRLGLSVIVAECPGVGENPLTYDRTSHQMIGALMATFIDQVDVDHTYFVGMSFGGTLGIKYALDDSRIRGITTVGAPLKHFYLDTSWFQKVPDTTKKTLAHLCKVDQENLFDSIQSFAIDDKEAQRLTVPLHYIFSKQDEIIPIKEKQYLKDNVSQLELIEFDDVHGSPHHMGEIQKYIPLSIIRQHKGKSTFLKWVLRFSLTIEMIKRRIRTSSTQRSEIIEKKR